MLASLCHEPGGDGVKFELPPLKPRALAVRAIPDAAADLARVLELPADRRALGIVTATSDDALFTALDQGTKASPADVVYARSFYAGAAHPSGPLSGECIGIYAARDPAEIEAALAACLAYLENEAWFYGVRWPAPRRRWPSIRTSSPRSAAIWRRWPTCGSAARSPT